MNSSGLKFFTFIIFLTCSLHAEPDISNLYNCIQEVRAAEKTPPAVLKFDPYMYDFHKLLTDLKAAALNLPHVYQEAAAQPLIGFLENLGELEYLKIFDNAPRDDQTALYQEIVPDAALAILFHENTNSQKMNAFQEIVSDLYEGFLCDEIWLGTRVKDFIAPPTYGLIPPMVKFGNPEAGPYTWPVDATNQILGMHCAVVSLPPSQLSGGLLAWTTLGHETGGHDVTHADEGLLDELAQKIYDAVYAKFHSKNLANYWANCIDEASADVFGYLNMGPSAALGLIGYFRALGNGKLRSVGSLDDPHPIDLLRGYLAASVVKRLNFKEAEAWSRVIFDETSKDNNTLYLVDQRGYFYRFPVSLQDAIDSADVVAGTIMHAKLASLEGHSIHKIQGWNDVDQEIVNSLAEALKTSGQLPANLSGPGLYAAHVVAASTQAALEKGANIGALFNEMHEFLVAMHLNNPTWSLEPTQESMQLLEQARQLEKQEVSSLKPHYMFSRLPSKGPSIEEAELLLTAQN